jgi:tRNA-splicing ligase RtcB
MVGLRIEASVTKEDHMRADPYQERARALAIEAGLNPDAKIDRPGQRPIPTWCTFRDAARKEHLAHEAEAVAADIAIQPQAAQYQNSPLKVFGQHDDATIAQMRNCMSVGNAVAGVICADGHLGYAQPVGGVIAYEKQISISGVGFDIGCFTGDTRIFTLDGQTPTLAECNGRPVWILACDANGKPVPAQGFCARTRRDAPLVRVTLDSGKSIRCTPDHFFMLRDGTYQRADSLSPGQSLMPLYMTTDRDGYVLVRNNHTRRLMRLHWMVYRAGLTEPAPDLGGDELVLHHRNFGRADNDPSNLQPMRKADHDAMHAAMRDKAHFNTPEFHERRVAAIKDFWIGARQDDDFMGRRRRTATTNVTGYMQDRPDHFRQAVQGNTKRGSSHIRRFNSNPLTVERTAERSQVPHSCPLCGLVTKGPAGLALHARFKHPEVALIARRGKDWRLGYPSIAECLAAAANNHKVASVDAIPGTEDAYCLSIPGLNNFALADGVFVHNCGNMAVRLDTPFSQIEGNIGAIIKDVHSVISFGVGRSNDERVEHELFDDSDAWRESEMGAYRQKAATQLGTVGSGNHYVDLMRDEAGFVWIGAHFGSRGLGHTSATRYLKAAGGKDGMNVPPAVIDEDSEIGRRYIAAMQLAGRYSYAGREWVIERVRDIIGGTVTDMVHNHHNYAWRENHGGRDLWVVRKGATPAFPGQRGFVGGSMGDDAVIVEGVDSAVAKASLYSTIHGAGRLFGRKEAKRRFTRAEMDAWLQSRGVTLIGADLDESPMAYRRLPEVLAEHSGSIKVLHTLRPFAVAMAGEGEFDPFKD